MGIFKRSKQNGEKRSLIQTERRRSSPFSLLDSYTPSAEPELKLYAALREAVPVIDAAIFKITRLVGGFRVECGNKEAEKEIDEFFKSVQVNTAQCGIESFVSSYLEGLLTYGTAVGEIVVNNGKIAALYNADLQNIELTRSENALKTVVCTVDGGVPAPVKYPELILLSVLNPDPASLRGNSLLKGLAFVSSVLVKIYNTIGLNFERIGNLRFAVTYKPQGDTLDKSYARENAQEIAQQWRLAMQPGDRVKDFICVGDVDIKVIGADNQVLDTEVPVRQILEQIVAKTGLPPFMLGLSWSSTERMSKQQADVLTSELEAYRRVLSPIIKKIAETFLRLSGHSEKCEVIWDDITLQDELELAQARLFSARAAEIEQNLTGSGKTGGENE